MMEYCEAKLAELSEGAEYPPETKADFSQQFARARKEIDRATGMGAFIISEDATKVLQALKKHNGPDETKSSLYEMVEDDWIAYRDCLENIRAIAKKDLRVR